MKKGVAIFCNFIAWLSVCFALGGCWESSPKPSVGGGDGSSGGSVVTPLDPECPSHVPQTRWSADAFGHWHACIFCDGEIDRQAHSFTALRVATLPNKVSYEAGTNFQTDGMVVVAACGGCEQEIEIADYMVVASKPLKTTDTSVTVRYGDMQTQITIEVAERNGGNWTGTHK